MSNSLFCSWCKGEMAYIHGHAACINNSCSMFGLNQAECCSGENVDNCVGTQQNEITLSPQRLQ
ncbi:MAG: hypothetical protein CL511_01340 [Actinobacteria bacterium]|jgi:hypothetical protein|nr:hypothetical protein [Actinomycetota bacterium]|tara:strand:+ start:2009 stop:2200 length:192 start_codon:yes stop_codon:yes gene_type:complete